MQSKMSRKVVNALSVDLEDYYHVYGFSHIVKYGDWEYYPSRIEVASEKVLNLLGEVKATFFTLGWVAKRYPNIIKKIHKAGHEIACHTFDHKLLTNQTPAEFRESVRYCKCLLEDVTGDEVIGYRASTFSVVRETLWALDILMEEGYLYDSSIYPIIHDRYGIPEAERFPFRIRKDNRELIEFPVSTVRFMGKNIPVGGGGYMRFFPYWMTKKGLSVLNGCGLPAVFYFHPWEIDVEQPRLSAGFLSGFRHYYNISRNEEKLSRLLGDFKFDSVRNVLKNCFLRSEADHNVPPLETR